VRGANGVQVLYRLVEVVERPYCFVQGAHDLGGVFGELEGALLLLLGPQFGELREQRKQLCVFLEQPESVARAKSIKTNRSSGESSVLELKKKTQGSRRPWTR